MTRRAFIWCGQTRGERDAGTSANDVSIAINSARALNVPEREIRLFACESLPGRRRHPVQHHDATIEELRGAIGLASEEASAEDMLLFVATNHGGPSGLMTSSRSDEFDLTSESRVLSERLLGQMLDPIEGSQILLIGACYSGLFLNIARTGRVVLSACDQNSTVQWEDLPPLCTPFLSIFLNTWTGASHQGEGDGRVPLKLGVAFELTKVALSEGPQNRPVPQRGGDAEW